MDSIPVSGSFLRWVKRVAAGDSYGRRTQVQFLYIWCGRYRLTRADKVASYFEAEAAEELHPRYNIAPSQQVAAIRQLENVRVISALRWGLVPFWAKDVAIGYKMINSRSESVLERPAFRDCFHQWRQLDSSRRVLMAGKKAGKWKQPFHFGMKDGSLSGAGGNLGLLEIAARDLD